MAPRRSARGGASRRLLAAAVVVACVGLSLAGAKDHRYKVQDTVPLYANKVGPFHNPRRVDRWIFNTWHYSDDFGERAIGSALYLHVKSPASLEQCARATSLSKVIASSRSETYQYYDLPFCPEDDGPTHKTEDLGEVWSPAPGSGAAHFGGMGGLILRRSLQVLEGDRMMSTPYEVPFRVDKENQKLCSKTLDGAALKKFRTAVKDDYYFQASELRSTDAKK